MFSVGIEVNQLKKNEHDWRPSRRVVQNQQKINNMWHGTRETFKIESFAEMFAGIMGMPLSGI